MSRVFVISDLHFGHAKVALDRGFKDVAQHDYALVEAWNRVVTKRDVVYVLGDVFRLDLVDQLRGTKKLAMGNHDQQPVTRYAALFSQVRACFEFDGCLLTHIPVNPSQFGRYELNVHGHTHRHRQDDLRYVPVAVEHCPRMEPMLLRDVIQARRQRIKDGPPECVLFAREAKKRFGVVGEWEDFRAPDDGALFFNDTDLHLVETRAAALGLPIDREDQNASLVRLFDFVAELLAAAREVGETFPVIASSTPQCHLAVQRLRAVCQRLQAEVPR